MSFAFSASALTSLTGVVGSRAGSQFPKNEPWAVPPIRPEILAEAERRLIFGAPLPVDEDLTD